MTWTPVTRQPGTWTATTRPVRGFDPLGFDRFPRFDTGSSAGLWDEKTVEPEAWTQA